MQSQIFEQVRAGIVDGRLRAREPLPSSRMVAEEHGVSRNTVSHAYDRLVSEGYLKSVEGIGTFVAEIIPERCMEAPPVGPQLQERRHPKRERAFVPPPIMLPDTASLAPRMDFWPGRPNRRHFPMGQWRRLIGERLTNASEKMTGYGDPMGAMELRCAIAEHLVGARGVAAAPDQVVVTGGTQDALNIVARLLVKQGTRVAVENPCYQGAASVFESHGAVLVPLRVDDEGMRTDELASTGAEFAYLTPSHQFPSGVTLSAERRRAALDWARRSGGYIIEDDYDGDYRYRDAPLAALAGMDESGSVIYLGTFSKTVGAGLRMGYAVVPRELSDEVRRVKALMSYGQPWLEQAVMAEFIGCGSFRRHLRSVRRAYQANRDTLLQELEAWFGPVDVRGADCGMHVVWRLPPWLPDAGSVAEATARAGVGVHTVESAGGRDWASGHAARSLVLGYSSLSAAEIRQGVEAMARATGQ